MADLLRISLMCLFLVSPTLQEDKRIPPHFLEKLRTSIFIGRPNEKTTFKCSAVGIPEPSISWYKDGEFIMGDSDLEDYGNGTLQVTTSSTTEGMYTCMASNDYGTTVSEEREVKVAMLRPPSQNKLQKSVVEGKSIVFSTLDVVSVPAATVLWYKLPDKSPETKELVLNERTYIDVKGRLLFGYVLKEDTSYNELYKGKCKNLILDQSYSCGVYNLTVSDAPNGTPKFIDSALIYSTPNEFVALDNKTMILECFIPSKPFENVKWSRENRIPLDSNRIVMDEWGFRITIKNVKPEDAGKYICQSGKISHTITVSVEAEPVFHNPPRDTNVTEGTDVVINCSNHALPAASVEWFLNSRKIQKNQAISRISISDDNQILLIRSVCRNCNDGRTTDSVVVQCRATNKHGQIFSSSYINVLKKTEVKLVEGEPEYILETGYEKLSIVLNCTSSSDPLTPVSPRWYSLRKKDHKELLVSDSEGMYVKDGMLIFNLNGTSSKLWKDYHGEYACIADNHYSTSIVTSKIFVKGTSLVVAGLINYWWIVAIAGILFLILLIAIILHCLFNVGDSYNVNKKELKNGNNPVLEIEEKDFKIYSRPEPVDFRGSQATLISKSSRDLSDNDMDRYPGRYADIHEDGSFLGVYTGESQRSFTELA